MNKRFKVLDGLRGVAAIAVLLYHAGNLCGITLIPQGYLAVDFFFPLSGFVIAQTYESRLLSGWSLRQFAVTRFIRVWPLIALGAVFGVATAALKMIAQHDVRMDLLIISALAAVLVIPIRLAPPSPPLNFPLNGPEWSLFAELMVNLLYAVLVRRATTRWVWAVVAVTGPAVVVASLMNGGINIGWTLEQTPLALLRAVFGFTLGIAVHRSPRLPALPLPILIVALLTPMFLPPTQLTPWTDGLSATILFPLLLSSAANSDATKISPVLILLGDLSYPLYAIHHPIARLIAGFAKSHGAHGLSAAPAMAGAASVALVVAYFASRLYDKPVRKLLTNLSRIRVAASTEAARNIAA